MGRLDVRTSIASAITAAAAPPTATIPFVGTVYAARPVVLEEQDYVQTMTGQAVAMTANGSSAVVVVNIASDTRERYSLVGRGNVADFTRHIVGLEIFFASEGGKGVQAQQDYDLIVDELIEFIRENPVMSAPAVVWSAGEYRYGVKHEQSQPYTTEDGLQILITGIVRFEAWEQFNGPIPQPPD